MRYLLISIKDRAIEAFQPIGNVRAKGEALRVFHDLLANQQAPQHAHPDDYDLYLVGYFDDQTGRLEALDMPEKLADGKTTAELNATQGS